MKNNFINWYNVIWGVIFAGVMFFLGMGMAKADVRVDIIRLLPNGAEQNIVQEFHDFDSFAMWMGTKMERGCDPYVTDVHINLQHNPKDMTPLGYVPEHILIRNPYYGKDFPAEEK